MLRLSLSETSSGWQMIANRAMLRPMWDLCRLTWWVLGDLFRPRAKLEAEILVLRQQINVLRWTAPKRLLLSSIERLIFVGLPGLRFSVQQGLRIFSLEQHRHNLFQYVQFIRIKQMHVI